MSVESRHSAPEQEFPPLPFRQLVPVRRSGVGVVLLDHHARAPERSSILHAATCPYLGRAGGLTPLRWTPDDGAALRWLRRHRGDLGEHWKPCPGGGGRNPSPGQAEASAVDAAPEGLRRLHEDLHAVGSVVGGTRAAAEVEVFQGPGTPPRRHVVPYAETSSFTPVPGDRIWLEQKDGGWVNAEVRDAEGETLIVTIAGAQRMRSLGAARFREFGPVADPLALLAAGQTGSVARVRARERFERSYLALADGFGGLESVASSGVTLFPHQLQAVRRVVNDSIQRYLLADEVGLGKTIEAGLIIKQRLIDAPRSVVLVLAPASLVPQWKEELDVRLGLGRFRRTGVEVLPLEEKHSWQRHTPPDLIVVDEAHRVAAGWDSPVGEHRERYEAARTLSLQTARLLLLSATPVLHRPHDL